MKQHAQINILHGTTQLRYLVEFNDILDETVTTHGFYQWDYVPDGIQFFRNTYVINNFNGSHIYNMVDNTNRWSIDSAYHTNMRIPVSAKQREMVVYIPRYSIESFFDNTFSDGVNLALSNIKYIVTAYIYIFGKKVILGSYMFDMRSAVATNNKVRYKNEDYMTCVQFDILDPLSITYDDAWKPFRTIDCGEPPYTNNTGSVLHIELTPVILGDDGTYIQTQNFNGGITGIPFSATMADYMHANLTLTGDAIINIDFNDVYGGDLKLYLAETYGLWVMDDDGNYLDINGNIITPDPTTGLIDDSLLVPRDVMVIYDIVIKDAENIYEYHVDIAQNTSSYRFRKHIIAQKWENYMDGLIMVAGVNIYDTSSTDIETIIDTLDPVVALVTNEIPLTKDNYKYLITTNIAGRNTRTINISRVNMYDYNVNIVNKIQKNVINVNRPEDYKSNIIKPVFYRSSSVDNLTIHPAVLENIGVNLNQYKSKVDLFYIKVEGVEFMEIGRTSNSVLFAIDGSKLPNKVESGIYYILNQDFEMVTSGKYKYEQ